jgi:hypothetical protein
LIEDFLFHDAHFNAADLGRSCYLGLNSNPMVLNFDDGNIQSARFTQRALFIPVKTKRSENRSMRRAGKNQENSI